ncbi:MAG: SpoIIE family protein phosphatase, partial [Oscillospiraceae bacterium]
MCISKTGIYSYLALCLFALGISVLFLVQFNSFVFLTTTAISLVGYFFMDKLRLLKSSYLQPSENLTGEKDYNALMSKLEKLNRSFRFLGNTVIDISNLLTKEDVPQELESLVCNEVCKSCKNSTYCWQEKFGDTQSQFSQYAAGLQKQEGAYFDDWFLSSCIKTDKLRESFERSSQLLCAKQLIGAAGRQSQKMLQNQFLTLSQTLQDITHESQKSGIVNTAFTHTISNLLMGMGKKINYCLCYQNNNKLVVSSKEPLKESDCCKLTMKLENLYCSRFSSSKLEQEGENYIYTFLEVPMFSFDFHWESKGHSKVCGDSCETLQTDDYFYVLLSDGMGTGSFAAAESRTAISMLKSLLGAAVKPKTAIDIVNIALNLKGTGQSCVSVDIMQVNLYNGDCHIIKAGAAASLLMHGNEVHTFYKDSLPIGILKDTNVAQTSFILNNGDGVILLSDGVSIKNNYMQRLKLVGSQYSS